MRYHGTNPQVSVGKRERFWQAQSCANYSDSEETGCLPYWRLSPHQLLHSIPKINSKLMASRLCLRMGELVSINQSTFIRGRSIHGNFMLVRQVARSLHRREVKGVLIKLDISHAFDSISWSFLFEVLEAKGFSTI